MRETLQTPRYAPIAYISFAALAPVPLSYSPNTHSLGISEGAASFLS